MDLLDQYYHDIAFRYEDLAQAVRKESREKNYRDRFPEAIEEAELLFNEGYRFKIEGPVEGIVTKEMIKPLIPVIIATRHKDGSKLTFQHSGVYYMDIERLKAGDVSVVLNGEFLLNIATRGNAPSWIKDLHREITREQGKSLIYAHRVLMHLHVLSKFRGGDED